MNDWLDGAIPYLKGLHIAALVVWCAGLFAVTVMQARHDPALGQAEFTRMRLAFHYSYTWVVTPAALFAVAVGTLLMFLREVFVAWMFAKLVFVALLVGFHAWVGGTIVAVGETRGERQTPEPLLPVLILLTLVIAILVLVLAKPALEQVALPDWLTEPRGGQLPFDVPRL